MAASAENHSRSSGQGWEKNETCRDDYRQSSERIFADPGIEPSTFFFGVMYELDLKSMSYVAVLRKVHVEEPDRWRPYRPPSKWLTVLLRRRQCQ